MSLLTWKACIYFLPSKESYHAKTDRWAFLKKAIHSHAGLLGQDGPYINFRSLAIHILEITCGSDPYWLLLRKEMLE